MTGVFFLTCLCYLCSSEKIVNIDINSLRLVSANGEVHFLFFFLFDQNLTEFNTAHNKRISLLTIEEGNLEIQRPKRKRRNSRVTFNEEDSIINPGVEKKATKQAEQIQPKPQPVGIKQKFDDVEKKVSGEGGAACRNLPQTFSQNLRLIITLLFPEDFF